MVDVIPKWMNPPNCPELWPIIYIVAARGEFIWRVVKFELTLNPGVAFTFQNRVAFKAKKMFVKGELLNEKVNF